jgi:hypothetical protein
MHGARCRGKEEQAKSEGLRGIAQEKVEDRRKKGGSTLNIQRTTVDKCEPPIANCEKTKGAGQRQSGL